MQIPNFAELHRAGLSSLLGRPPKQSTARQGRAQLALTPKATEPNRSTVAVPAARRHATLSGAHAFAALVKPWYVAEGTAPHPPSASAVAAQIAAAAKVRTLQKDAPPPDDPRARAVIMAGRKARGEI